MALPQLNSATYELIVPSTQELVKYRPYLVKEEKILMLAMESGDETQILNATAEIVKVCTFNKVDALKLPMVDMEYIFLKLRSKSVGETAVIGVKCTQCESFTSTDINLEDIVPSSADTVEPTIQLTDEVGVKMKYPTVSDLQKATRNKDNNVETVFGVIAACIESIYDTNNVYPAADHSPEELVDFLESLNQSQFGQVQKWFESMPKLTHTIEFTCTSCQHENKVTLEGLQSFFA